MRRESASSSSSSSWPAFFRQPSMCHVPRLHGAGEAAHIIWYGGHITLIHLASFSTHSVSFSCFISSSYSERAEHVHAWTHVHTHTSLPTTVLISAVVARLNHTPLICSGDWLQWLKGFSHFFHLQMSIHLHNTALFWTSVHTNTHTHYILLCILVRFTMHRQAIR